jgi:hypothetical protein
VLEIFVYDVVSKIVAEMLEASLVMFLVVPQIFAHFQLRPKRFENIIRARWIPFRNVIPGEIAES